MIGAVGYHEAPVRVPLMARDDLGFGDDATRPLPGTSLIQELAEVPGFLTWQATYRACARLS
jgi:hypothetical protein